MAATEPASTVDEMVAGRDGTLGAAEGSDAGEVEEMGADVGCATFEATAAVAPARSQGFGGEGIVSDDEKREEKEVGCG